MGALDRLRTELLNDPDVRGYAALSDAAVVVDLNTPRIDNWGTITAADIYESLDDTEWGALNNAGKAELDIILGLGGQIATAPGGKVRAKLIELFGGGSATLVSLIALANPDDRKRTTAQNLRLGGIVPSDVAKARPI